MATETLPDISLDDESNLVLSDVDFFREGRGLSVGEKSVINPRDNWAVTLVNRMNLADQTRIGNCFFSMDIGHYNNTQLGWFGKEFYLVGTRMGCSPQEPEVFQDANKHHNLERYRLLYVLNFPHKTKLNTDNYSRERNDADLFLAMAQTAHPFCYSYFEKIWCNSLLTQD